MTKEQSLELIEIVFRAILYLQLGQSHDRNVTLANCGEELMGLGKELMALKDKIRGDK